MNPAKSTRPPRGNRQLERTRMALLRAGQSLFARRLAESVLRGLRVPGEDAERLGRSAASQPLGDK